MWPRVLEFVLACWLAISPFVFRSGAEVSWLWTNDLVCAFAVAAAALLSLHHRLHRTHLANLAVALWLIGLAFARTSPPPAAYQNDLVVGLLLILFTIIPSRAAHPPRAWQRFFEQAHGGGR
ncbi:MAG TPA: hypothetical protein P5572_12405 [Phycisphaerae bacterium]|nr:hypothetical protein [Phycisphaerae bacterium]